MKSKSKASPREDNLLPQGLKKRRSPHKKFVVNVAYTRYPIIEQICKELSYSLSYDRDNYNWNIYWTDSEVSIDFLSRMHSHQKVNHFSGIVNLSRKALLAKNIKRMQKAFPESYAFCPLTFVLPQDIFLFNKFQDRERLKGERCTFIIKPQIGSQGREIYLWQDNIELEARKEIVQMYIERPLLYKGLKFDLRVYVLVTGCAPLRMYIFNEGLVRFATEIYQRPSSQNIEDLRMHLTNYAINRENPKYIFNDSLEDLSKGHKKSLAEFFRTMRVMGLPAHQYWAAMKDIAVKTLIAGLPFLKKEYEIAQPTNKENNMCFELLGLDFLIEQNHRVYLLEVNHTPSFFTDTPLEHLVKSNLIHDTFQLIAKEQKMRIRGPPKLEGSSQNIEEREVPASDVTFTITKEMATLEEEQQQQHQLDEKYLGSFERIYPCSKEDKQQKYSRLIAYSLSSISFQSTSHRRKTMKTPPLSRRLKTEPKRINAFQDFSYPPKEKTRASRVLKQEQLRQSESRGVANVFDRENFRQEINRRNYQLKTRREREFENDDSEGVRGEEVENAAELSDIIEYHRRQQLQEFDDRQQKRENYY